MTDLSPQDLRLLDILQHDGKLPVQDLARRAGLSASPAWRRVRRLEEAGVIARYVALLDPKALGLDTMAYVHVSLTDHNADNIARFDRFVDAEPHIVECCSITGTDDYLLKIVVRDAEALEAFLMNRLLAMEIVRSTTTHFVLRQKKYATALPLGQ